jgi:hypothetical protein
MKHLFIIAAFFFTTHLYGQTRIEKNNPNVINPTNQKKPGKNQPSKIQASYLDSLRILKDTVSYFQIIGLRKLNFYSGTIYFAGSYYENVTMLKLNSKSDSTFNKYFDRCAPGSKLAFENVTWKDKNGVITGPLTKLFILY